MTTQDTNPANYGPYDVGDKTDTLTLAAKITANNHARAWFEHGLAWVYGYNHEEAIACFQKALGADEDCAMAWWGIAYSLSSSYNWAPGLGCGYDAIQAALGIVGKPNVKLSPLEVDLIKALSARSSEDVKAKADPTKLNFGNNSELNQAFADEMAKVYAKYPTDNDVAAVYAESLMNLKPWAMWTRDYNDGKIDIQPADKNTNVAMKVIETGFKNGGKRHPALCHLYCHLLELSPFPEKALKAADTLRTLMPAMGHLVHMPSHIDAWVGGYENGVNCNVAGTDADDKYVETSGNESQFYKFYRMHNMHFVVWMAMHDGQYSTAMKFARKMLTQLTKEHVTFMLAGVIPMGAVFLEAFATMIWHVMIRFGRWNEIMSEPIPEGDDVYPACIATAHYARGVACASLGKVTEAKTEQEKFLKACENPALAGRLLHNNLMISDDGPCVLKVAEAMLEGEILYRDAVINSTDREPAFKALRKAVELSEKLKYDEPWGWAVPARHALGALLFESDRLEEAEAVYRADIALWKDNMWGLFGLHQVLKKTENGFAIKVEERLKNAMVRSEIKLTATCFCAKAAGAADKPGCC